MKWKIEPRAGQQTDRQTDRQSDRQKLKSGECEKTFFFHHIPSSTYVLCLQSDELYQLIEIIFLSSVLLFCSTIIAVLYI